MSDATARTAAAVAILVEDRDAQRLAVSWHLVEPGLRDAALRIAWSRVSGVPLSVVSRRAEVLIRHGICREDRSLEPEAARVLQHLAAETLRSTQRRRR